MNSSFHLGGFHVRIALSRVFAVLALALVGVARSPYQDKIPGDLLVFLGWLLVAVAVVGRLWCALYIGGYKNTILVTQGPYSLTRNPLYFFSLLGMLGVACTSAMLTLVVLVALIFALSYPATIRCEEAFLRGRFGEAFERFCVDTPCFFPNFRRYREANTWKVHPKEFLRMARDVVWFIWLAALVRLVQSTHRWIDFSPLLLLP